MLLRWYRERTLEQWQALDLEAFARVAAVVEEAQSRGRFIWVCGNGGSAAISAHIGCDFGKTDVRDLSGVVEIAPRFATIAFGFRSHRSRPSRRSSCISPLRSR